METKNDLPHQCQAKDGDIELSCYGDLILILDMTDDYGVVGEFEVNYCPFCGKKAKEQTCK